MASDLDTVRVLRALFNDMPRAPQGLTHLETMAWIKQSMNDFEGGDMAYTIEHITRNAMLDIVLRMREDGPLADDAAFDEIVALISTKEGRSSFMDRCIQAQKSGAATERLLARAQRPWTEPEPLFVPDPQEVQRFVAAQASGPGPMFAEYSAREDVRQIGVFEQPPEQVHEFAWGFVTEDQGDWNFYLAEVWRQGTVGYFERFLSAVQLETTGLPEGPAAASPMPACLTLDVGIGAFSSLTLHAGASLADPAARRWVGEVFIAGLLPRMAARVLDECCDFPERVQ